MVKSRKPRNRGPDLISTPMPPISQAGVLILPKTLEVTKLAVETCLWSMYEMNGEITQVTER